MFLYENDGVNGGFGGGGCFPDHPVFLGDLLVEKICRSPRPHGKTWVFGSKWPEFTSQGKSQAIPNESKIRGTHSSLPASK